MYGIPARSKAATSSINESVPVIARQVSAFGAVPLASLFRRTGEIALKSLQVSTSRPLQKGPRQRGISSRETSREPAGVSLFPQRGHRPQSSLPCRQITQRTGPIKRPICGLPRAKSRHSFSARQEIRIGLPPVQTINLPPWDFWMPSSAGGWPDKGFRQAKNAAFTARIRSFRPWRTVFG